jgi:hypothetical protein
VAIESEFSIRSHDSSRDEFQNSMAIESEFSIHSRWRTAISTQTFCAIGDPLKDAARCKSRTANYRFFKISFPIQAVSVRHFPVKLHWILHKMASISMGEMCFGHQKRIALPDSSQDSVLVVFLCTSSCPLNNIWLFGHLLRVTRTKSATIYPEIKRYLKMSQFSLFYVPLKLNSFRIRLC